MNIFNKFGIALIVWVVLAVVIWIKLPTSEREKDVALQGTLAMGFIVALITFLLMI